VDGLCIALSSHGSAVVSPAYLWATLLVLAGKAGYHYYYVVADYIVCADMLYRISAHQLWSIQKH
jgi:hypothetical protein